MHALYRARSNSPRPVCSWQAELVPVTPFLWSTRGKHDKTAQGTTALGQNHTSRPRLRRAGERLGDVWGPLLAQTKTRDRGAITLNVLVRQVSEQAAPLPDQLQQTTA